MTSPASSTAAPTGPTPVKSTISLKYSDLIPQFSGDSDFLEWLQKFQLVVDLQGVSAPEKFLPLFLTGDAFTVYQSQDAAVKADFLLIKKALKTSFSTNQFQAYSDLTARRLRPGESVDGFAADLVRLVSLVCDRPDDRLTKCAFICGLPEEVRSQIQASCLVASMSLSEVISKARSLVTNRERCFVSQSPVCVEGAPVCVEGRSTLARLLRMRQH